MFLRKIAENPKCPICKSEEETAMHVLWHCLVVDDVWSESMNVVQKWRSNETNLLALWERLMEKVSKSETKEIAMMMRSLWPKRNELIFERIFKSPSQLVRLAREELKAFQMAS